LPIRQKSSVTTDTSPSNLRRIYLHGPPNIGICDDGVFKVAMPLPNPAELISRPPGGNADDRHQHEQRPQAEPESAAFRFVFIHGGSV
jgi:hypothetical protein